MKVKKINTRKLEINKPSELCQVMFFSDYNETIFAELTPTQIDLINLIVYEAKKIIIKNSIEVDTENTVSMPINLELQTFSNYLNKWKHHDYLSLVSQLNGLRKLDIVINSLKKNKEMETTLTSFIHEIRFSRHKSLNKKVVKIFISTKIISMFLNVKKMFSKFHLTIQFSMKSKYSKLLYELLKDYEKIKTISIDFELLIGLLNAGNHKRYYSFSYFNNDILKKAIKEINEKSDIIVDYEPIKEKPSPQERKRVTKIKFNIRPQPKSRLKELGLIDQKPNYDIALYNKSKSKLDKLIKNGYDVIDEEMWIETDINKNKEEYEAQIRIDKWMKETDKEIRNNIFETIAQSELEDEMVVGLDGYNLKGLVTEVTLTKNARETLEIMNKHIKDLINN